MFLLPRMLGEAPPKRFLPCLVILRPFYRSMSLASVKVGGLKDRRKFTNQKGLAQLDFIMQYFIPKRRKSIQEKLLKIDNIHNS